VLVELASSFEGADEPRIVGVLHVGSDLARARAGKSFYYQPPPYALVIEVRGPGALHVYQGAIKLAALESGGLQDQMLVSAFDFAPAGDILRQGEHALSPRITAPNHEPLREWAEFQWTALLNTVLAVVNAIEEHGHGGTLLLVEPGAIQRLSLKLKYQTDYDTNFLDDRFVGFINARHELADASFLRDNNVAGAPSADQIQNFQLAVIASERELSDAAETVAAFSRVDGALVLTAALRVVGFGAEILLEKAPPTKIFEVTGNPLATEQRSELDSESFGMRHRSAMRFVGATSGSVAFIVSQDGKISFCWSKQGVVYMKRGVNVANPNMVGA